MNEKQQKHVETVVTASGKLLDLRTHPDDVELLTKSFPELVDASTGSVYIKEGNDILKEHYAPLIVDIAMKAANGNVTASFVIVDALAYLTSEIAKRFYELGYLADRES